MTRQCYQATRSKLGQLVTLAEGTLPGVQRQHVYACVELVLRFVAREASLAARALDDAHLPDLATGAATVAARIMLVLPVSKNAKFAED